MVYAMTDNFNLGSGLSVHNTINLNLNLNLNGNIIKQHMAFDIRNQQIKIYPGGNTSLKK